MAWFPAGIWVVVQWDTSLYPHTNRNHMITLATIQSVNPCWESSRLISRVPSEGVTWQDIAMAEDVSLADRRWLMTRLAAETRVGRNILILWAAESARSVLHNIPEGVWRVASQGAIDAAIICAKDNTPETRSAAGSAAWSAESAGSSAWSAWSAAWYAAGSAARAAWSAAGSSDAAGSAAWYAAGSAARAAWSAAGSSESAASAAESRQLMDLATVLEGAGL